MSEPTDAPIRVLYVEGEGSGSLAAESIARESDRIEVETAGTSTEGISRVRDGGIDCVVSDGELSGTSGIEFLETVREEYPELPFILFTDTGSEAVASRAVSAEVTDYFRKGGETERHAMLARQIENAVDRHRSERAADRRKRRLETLLSNLPGIVYRCRNEPGWPMESVDGECTATVGYSCAELQSGAVEWGPDVIHEDDREAVWETVQAALAEGEPFECTYRVVTADGDLRWMWERGRVVDGETGTDEPTALEGFITDVTARKERERELRRQHERIDEFASFVSHDLQSPISVARGRLELAAETGDLEHVEKARDAIERIDDLRANLVETLRSGDVVAETKEVAVDTTLESVWRTIDPPQAASFTVVDPVSVEADPDAFRRLLENLLRNSIEHGSDDVEIRLGGLPAGFYYEDDGDGIDPEIRERVFQSGFSTKDSGEETGMGMASIRQIVSAHGWDIDVGDADVLDGVRFEIRTDR